MATYYQVSGAAGQDWTESDVVMIANGAEYADGAYVMQTPWDSKNHVNTNIYYRGWGFTQSNAQLIVGGNYDDIYNIGIFSLGFLEGNDSGKYWLCDMGLNYWTGIYAVKFQQNGTITLASQTGPRTADASHLSDDKIKIGAGSNTGFDYTCTFTSTMRDSNPTKTFYVNAIDADGDLSFASSVVGTITASQNVAMLGYTYETTESGKKKTLYGDVASGLDITAHAIHGKNVILTANHEGTVSGALNTVEVTGRVGLAVSNNNFSAEAIHADADVTTRGIWAGNTAGTIGNVTFSADYAKVQKKDPSATEAPSTKTTSVSGNTVLAAGVNAGGKFTASTIGATTGAPAVISGAIGDVTIYSAAKGKSEDSVSSSVSNNEIKAYGISADSIEVGTVEEGVAISAAVGTIALTATAEGGKANSNAVSLSNNTIDVKGINASNITLGSFFGDVAVSGTVAAETIKTDSKNPASGNKINFAGIYATNSLAVSGILGGSITVDANVRAMTDYRYMQAQFAGIYATTLTIDGRIDTNITVDAYQGFATGIFAKKFSAEAYTGTMTVTADIEISVGLYVADKMVQADNLDAFDISGTISVNGTAVMTGYDGGANLRVSGTLEVDGYAILTATHVILSTQNYEELDGAYDDVVELAAGAVVHGDIELRRSIATDRVILNSGAEMQGNIYCSGGVLNLSFVLDGAASANAILTTTAADYTVTSLSAIGVSLDYAKEGETYTLIDYSNVYTADEVFNMWKNRKISFVWHGQEDLVAEFKGTDTATVTFADGATATVKIDGTKLVVTDIANVGELAALDASLVVAAYDGAAGTYTLDWSEAALLDADWAAAMDGLEYYEIEYSINGGKTIVQRYSSTETAAVIKGIQHGDTVSWRIRGTSVDALSSAYYYKVNNWSDAASETVINEAAPSIDVTQVAGSVSGSLQSQIAVEGSAAIFRWNAPIFTNTVLDHYEVEYYESGIQLSKEDAMAAIESGATTSKTTSANMFVATSLTSRSYIYWRVRAVDIYGNVSDWVQGDDFRVFIGDTEAPVFPNTNITVQVDKVNPDDLTQIDMTISWNAAVDEGSGIKKYVVKLSDGVNEWIQELDNVDGQATYSYKFTGLTSGDFTYSITAVDNNLHEAIISGSYSAPSIPSGIFGTLNAPVISITYSDGTGANTGDENGENTGDTGNNNNNDTTTTPSRPATGIGSTSVQIGGVVLPGVDPDDVYSDNGSGAIGPDGKPALTYSSATATFTWEDTFTSDEPIFYALEFSDTANFSGEVFVYYTKEASAGAGTHTVVLSQDPGSPIGILSKLSGGSTDEIFWRVKVGTLVDGEFQSFFTSSTNGFQFVDSEGKGLPHLEKPDTPKGLYITQEQVEGCYDGIINWGFESWHTDLGITSYTVTITNLDDPSLSFSVSYNYNNIYPETSESGNASDLHSAYNFNEIYGGVNYDGNYTFSVDAFNSIGQMSSSDKYQFVVDATRPTTVEGITVETYASDVILSWGESFDAFGLAGYDVYYRIQGSEEWTKLATALQETSFTINALDDGTYEFAIYANDVNGNRSLDSEVINVTVFRGNDFENSYIPYKWTEFAGDNIVAANTIGQSDSADYFYIWNDTSFSLDVTLTDMEAIKGSNAGVLVSVYAYDGSGKEKAVASFKGSEIGAGLSGLLLDKGIYFFTVTALDSSSISGYQLEINKNQFGTTDTNTSADDNGLILDPALYPALSLSTSPWIDWVGYGDTIDYRKLDLTDAGEYTISLAGNGAPVTLTVYQQITAKNGTVSLKKVKTISTSAKESVNAMALLLESNDTATYFVSVSIKGKGPQESDYSVTLDANKLYSIGDNGDDNWMTLDDAVYLPEGKASSPFVDWVGFGDAIDYRKLDLPYSGSFDFTFDCIDNAATFTIYQETVDKKGNIVLKKIKSVSGKAGKSGELNGLLLDRANTYYFAVENKGAAKDKNTGYNVWMDGVEFDHAGYDNADDTWQLVNDATPAYDLTYGASETNWVGYGDAIDYRKLDLANSGKYDFELDGVSAGTKLTVWQLVTDKKGNESLKQVKTITVKSGAGAISDLLLDKNNTYFLSVAATGAAKGQNSEYTLTVNGQEFAAGRNGDDWTDLAVKGAASAEYGSFGVLTNANVGTALVRTDDVTGEIGTSANWVGYGDDVDYIKITLTSSGKIAFDITANDNIKFSLNALNDGKKGYELKSLLAGAVSTKGGVDKTIQTKELFLEAGEYYIAVSSTNAAKGGAADYTIALSGSSVIFPVSNNNDTNWKEASQQTALELDLANDVTLADWVGFGSETDTWKVRVKEGGVLELTMDAATEQAWLDGAIDFTCCDSNGKALNLDDMLNQTIAEGLYYVGVSCNDPKKYDAEYNVTLGLA